MPTLACKWVISRDEYNRFKLTEMNQKVMIMIAKQVQECCKKSPDGRS